MSSEPGEPLVQVRDIALRFGGVKALGGVSFDVWPGELFAIIGPNGAGKTSIFNVLSGVYRPQAGTVSVTGIDVVGMKPAAVAGLGVARTFQNLGLFTSLDVAQNVMLGRHHLMRTGFLAAAVWFGRARREEIGHRRRVEEIIEMLDLGPYRSTPAGVLPYGVQKRVELGRALAMDPRVLLLDEPVAGMNLEETEDMARFVLEIRAQSDIAMVMVEHDMHLVMDIADRVMAIDFGVPLVTGEPAVVQADPRVIEAYLGRASEPTQTVTVSAADEVPA
jgi:branched-chain amino acid transport system ATP-binding protein